MNTFVKIGENFASFWNLLVLNRHDLCNPAIYQRQNRKLKKLMKRAYQIPFYRKKFEEAGLTPDDIKTRRDLVKFPILTKQEIKEWLTPLIESEQDRMHIVSTSGSTGTPLKTMVSPGENAFLTANWLRIAMQNGINPFTAKTLALKDPKIVEAGNESIIQKLGILRRKKLPFTAEPDYLVEEFNKYKPDFFYAHKTKLLQMIDYAEKNNITLYHPPVYAVISEMISEQDEKVFRQYLGNNIFTSYGCMETGACTFTPVGSIKKHIITNDTHIINVVNSEGNLDSHGKMFLTNLNFLMYPIINYDVGDNADVYEENGIEFIAKIHGRVNDWICLQDGRKYDYHPFYRAFEGQDKVIHFRIIQEDYSNITIQLVASANITETEKRHIEQDVSDQLKQIIHAEDLVYAFDWRDKIEPDKSGKTRFIVSKVNEV